MTRPDPATRHVASAQPIGRQWVGICRCGWRSPQPRGTRSEAADDSLHHEDFNDIERVTGALRRR
jgi:hypothetical protein